MYSPTDYETNSFTLANIIRSDDASRLINNLELLIEDAEENLARVGLNEIEGFGPEAISDMTEAVEAAREVVVLIKAAQLNV